MFCKAEVCSTPLIQWFVVGAITVQDLYCTTMPEVTMQKGYCRILDVCNKAGRVIPWWKQMRGCLSAWPWSQYIMKERVHPCLSPHPAPVLTFWVRDTKLMARGWREASLRCAGGRPASLPGETVRQVGGKGPERGEKDTFAALSLLQQLLCQMYSSQASQLRLADGTEQPERSCWE